MPVQQLMHVQSRVDSSKDTMSQSVHLQSPPKVQRIIKPDNETSPLGQKQVAEVTLEQTATESEPAQQYLQIVGEDGKTQLIQIVGNSTDQQVFQLVTTPGQQPMLKPVQKQQECENTQTVYQDEQVQYVSESLQGHIVIGQNEAQEQIIITGGGDEQVIQEHVVVTEGSEEQIVYSDATQSRLIVGDAQTEHIIVSGGAEEQVVMTGYPQEQVVEEIVMEEVPRRVAQRQIILPANPVAPSRPALQSLLRKQPERRSTAGVSVLKPQIQQQIAGGVPVMIVTQGNVSSHPQTIYSVPSSSQTSVVTAGQQGPPTAVVITSGSDVVQADNIIETAFVAATQGENEAETTENNDNSRVALQVPKQPQVIVQQQPQQQVVVGQSGEIMNIDDIEVEPLQSSKEDLMRTMESIASELLGFSSIDLPP